MSTPGGQFLEERQWLVRSYGMGIITLHELRAALTALDRPAVDCGGYELGYELKVVPGI